MHSNEPTYLFVPFYDEERAIFLGARYDADRRQYYVPARTDFLPFREWFRPRKHYRRRADASADAYAEQRDAPKT